MRCMHPVIDARPKPWTPFTSWDEKDVRVCMALFETGIDRLKVVYMQTACELRERVRFRFFFPRRLRRVEIGRHPSTTFSSSSSLLLGLFNILLRNCSLHNCTLGQLQYHSTIMPTMRGVPTPFMQHLCQTTPRCILICTD